MADDGGVLGNLPRSRPGQRSDKRPGEEPVETVPKVKAAPKAKVAPKVKAGPKAKVKAAPKGGPAAKPKAAAGRAKPKVAAAKPVSPAADIPVAEPPPPPRPAPERDSDRVSELLRGAGKVAGTGVRVAAGLAQEVARRLPRR